ncbi:MAG: DUF4380 domain-containing protein [Steroidobacter sp.]
MIPHDNLYRLDNGTLSFAVNAQHGARITSLRFNDIELLTQPEDHPQNHGSTLWYAPQSHWHWPPPVALDTAPYDVKSDSGQLTLTSAADSASGLQFIKRFRLHDKPCHLELEYIIRNTAAHPVTAGAWELTRMPGGLTFFPSPSVAARLQSTLPDVQIINAMTWYTMNKTTLPVSAKAFFDVDQHLSQAWLASVTAQRLMLVKSFPVLRPENYSDGHAAIEVYGHEQGAYVELENHGPRTQLEPDAALSHVVRWHVQAIPDDVEVRAGNRLLVEFAQALINTKNS